MHTRADLTSWPFVGEGIFLRRILKNKNMIVMILSPSTGVGHPSLKSYESLCRSLSGSDIRDLVNPGSRIEKNGYKSKLRYGSGSSCHWCRSGSRKMTRITSSSVSDPGCLSRILIFTHPGSTNFTKLWIIWSAEEKNLGQFSKNYRTFYQ